MEKFNFGLDFGLSTVHTLSQIFKLQHKFPRRQLSAEIKILMSILRYRLTKKEWLFSCCIHSHHDCKDSCTLLVRSALALVEMSTVAVFLILSLFNIRHLLHSFSDYAVYSCDGSASTKTGARTQDKTFNYCCSSRENKGFEVKIHYIQ